MRPHAHVADQLYTQTDLGRLLKVGDRIRELRESGKILGPDVMVPGGGRSAARWTASRVAEIQRMWRIAESLPPPQPPPR